MSTRFLVCVFILWTTFVTYSAAQTSQYYNHNCFYNIKKIKNEQICRIDAYVINRDSNSTPLENFAFTSTFDSDGNLIDYTYWNHTPYYSNHQIKALILQKDSCWFVSETNQWKCNLIRSSKPFKYNTAIIQNKSIIKRINNSIRSSFKSVKSSSPYQPERFYQMVDTTLFDMNVKIPSFLLPNQTKHDSVAWNADTIFIYPKMMNAIYAVLYVYLNAEGQLQIDWYYMNDLHSLWRRHIFNKEGLLYKEKQDLYETIYFYDKTGFQIKTEAYYDNILMNTVVYEYRKNCN